MSIAGSPPNSANFPANITPAGHQTCQKYVKKNVKKFVWWSR